mgnify:CR=1 FL=1
MRGRRPVLDTPAQCVVGRDARDVVDHLPVVAREEARRTRWGRVALWIGALSLAVLREIEEAFHVGIINADHRARVGDLIELRLSENASTGYRWTLDHLDAHLFEVGDTGADYPDDRIGSGGTVSFHITVVAAGNGTLPAVSWVVPNQALSEHPPSSIHAGHVRGKR